MGMDSRSTVYTLAIPTNTNVIYVGTESLGVYKSNDGGASWNAFNDGLPAYNIRDNGQRDFWRVSSILIDPANPNIIYAGTQRGVFKSTSGGSWSALNDGLTNLGINGLAIDPHNPDILYTGTDGGVFKSSSSGASWKAMNKGLRGINVSSVAVNPGNANVYAGSDSSTFKSIDNGKNWSPNNFFPLGFDPRNPNIIYARVGDSYQLSKSTNGGATWINAHPGSADAYASLAVVAPSNSSVIYVLTDSLFKSTDGGASWNTTGGFIYPSLLVIDPKDPSTLYATYDDCYSTSVFKSTDGGATWNRSDSDGGTFLDAASALAIDPINTATLSVSACTLGADTCGIYKSTDGGKIWNRIGAELPSSGVSSLVIDPVHPNVLYAGTYDRGGLPATYGVFKSVDGGQSWSPMTALTPPHDRATGAVVEQGVVVEGGHDLGLQGTDEGGDRGSGAEAGVDPSVHGDHEHRLLEHRIAPESAECSWHLPWARP